jgi:3-dehydroquinate dehydratase-2
MTILIVNGPNLNLLGKRNPALYGNQSFEEFLKELRCQFPQLRLEYFQSNHEGALIDFLQEQSSKAVSLFAITVTLPRLV